MLFYNTELPTIAARPTSGSTAALGQHPPLPLRAPGSPARSTWNGLVIYQDRQLRLGGDDLTVNGNASVGMDVRGTIYLPDGDVKVNGNQGGW